MKKILYTKKEVATLLNCSISKIDQLIKNKQISYFKYGKTNQSLIKFAEMHISDYLKSVQQSVQQNSDL